MPWTPRAPQARPRPPRRNGAAARARAAAPGPSHRRARHRSMSEVSSARCSAVLLIAARPAALAFAEFRRRQQFAQRQDAGQRRADLVGDIGERRLDRARIDLAAGVDRRMRGAFAASRARGVWPAAVFDFAIAPPARACHGVGRPPPALKRGPPCGGCRRRLAPASRSARKRGRTRRFRELLPVGITDQPMVVIASAPAGRAAPAATGARWSTRTGPARAPRR